MRAQDLSAEVTYTKTGFASIDNLFGGGIVHGKILEIAGSWSVGKSTIAYQIIGAAQKQNRPCLLLDAERAYTKEYGAALGVDNSQLDIFRARTGEEYLDHIFDWIEGKKDAGIKSHKHSLVVIDA